jgi:membrane protein YqaA with SNARE-associated domain
MNTLPHIQQKGVPLSGRVIGSVMNSIMGMAANNMTEKKVVKKKKKEKKERKEKDDKVNENESLSDEEDYGLKELVGEAMKDIPLKKISMMSGGALSLKMVEGIIDVANGNLFRGIKKMF